MAIKEQRKTIEILMNSLAAALSRRGLSAETAGANMVWAVNRAADAPAGDPMGAAMSPGLRQAVVCRTDRDGQLLWWWVWSGPTRDAPSEYEPLGPAADVDTAANRIANVLRLDAIEPKPTP